MKAISIVEYIHELKEAGFTDKQAEVQAKKLEQMIIDMRANLHEEIKQELDNKTHATRGDVANLRLEIEKVRSEIEKSKNQVLLWIGAQSVFVIGIMAKGFHWF